ncbi:MAG TPA: aminoglycoside phosphotransferase family protein [Victivallales bacterium]|nr:aminoglycoside phosphotransferase family protein [Victivallales bacterium]
MDNILKEVSECFRIYGDFISAAPYGSGHINWTYKVTFNQGGNDVSYIFQRINSNIFKNPRSLMDNISRVLEHQKKKMKGVSDISRRSMTLIPTTDGKAMHKDCSGNCWRVYIFIDKAKTYDIVENADLAFNAAKAYGNFQKTLVDIPGKRLNETIIDFHNTPKRFDALGKALSEDIGNRAKDVKKEIDFIMSKKHLASKLIDLHRDGKFPERICHYDTKLNNVLIDDKTKEGICVIDLDTIMPGFVMFDFGDLLRTATSPVAEDERDLSKITMQMHIFKAMAKGYLLSARDFLNKYEKENLVFGGLLITLENAVRFLMDHLQMDTYYKIHREGHNLDRARTQIALVKSIENQYDEMNKFISEL